MDCICAEANVGEGVADGDLLVGQLLKLSTMQCPTLAKTWFTLANWCYKWGRKAVDNAAYVHCLCCLKVTCLSKTGEFCGYSDVSGVEVTFICKFQLVKELHLHFILCT